MAVQCSMLESVDQLLSHRYLQPVNAISLLSRKPSLLCSMLAYKFIKHCEGDDHTFSSLMKCSASLSPLYSSGLSNIPFVAK
jgi:hypothetical protein